MKGLSLIHAIVLLNEEEPLSAKDERGSFVRNQENMEYAEKLICQVLRINDRELPQESQTNPPSLFS